MNGVLLGLAGFAADTLQSLERFSGFKKVAMSVNHELLNQVAV